MVLCHPKHASDRLHTAPQAERPCFDSTRLESKLFVPNLVLVSPNNYIPESSFVPRLRLRPVPSGVVSSPSREFFLELGLLFRPPFFVSSSPLTIGGLNNKIHSDTK